MALIVLDRQHTGKPGQDDTGAWGDFNGNRKPEVMELEAILTGYYGFWCEVRLRELGHEVVVLSDGFYSDRHKRANAYQADAYIALHLNAGGGDYSLALHDYRSAAGKALAASITESWTKVLPVAKHHVKPTAPEGEFPRAYPCISGVFAGKPVAALVEPLFVDNPKHQQFLRDETKLHMLGYSIADGIHAWLATRK